MIQTLVSTCGTTDTPSWLSLRTLWINQVRATEVKVCCAEAEHKSSDWKSNLWKLAKDFKIKITLKNVVDMVTLRGV